MADMTQRIESKKNRLKVVKLSQRKASNLKSVAFTNLVVSVTEGPFVKVKDMIYALISRLEMERVVEQFAGGAFKALANRDDTEGNMYAGVCAFKDAKQEAFKCDTVDITYEDGNASTCGGGDFDGACFSLVPGIVWQCFPEHLQNEFCSATPRSDGLYRGTCVFETSELYVDAKDASAFQAREPLTFLEQSDESDENEDPFFYVPGVADESRERRMRRQPSQPLNPSLPECTDLPSFKHKYTDEETEETVFYGQCDIQEASNTVQVLTPATVTKFTHYQRHIGWCDTELTTNTQTKAEKTATLDSQIYNVKQLVDNMNKNKVLKQIIIQGKDREMTSWLTI